MTFIDFHIFQTVGPSNINRDDTGAPKTAVFGGVRRARVSSQSWKRAIRTYFNSRLDASDIGYRTRRIVELVAAELAGSGFELAKAEELAAKAVTATGIVVKAPKKKAKKDAAAAESDGAATSDYLVFVSAGQVRRLAECAAAAARAGGEVSKAEAKAAFKADASFDVALFGRMVADDKDLNVDAAVQVAHALSVQAVEDSEFDYFTAVDDLQERDNQSGAAMIGSVEFNSSTLYRYATLGVDQLLHNLGDPAAAARAASAFAEAFVRSMPTGKQNTFANRTLPDAVVVVVRDDQPVNLVGAFELPVRAGEESSTVVAAAQALTEFHGEIVDAYGSPKVGWVTGRATATEHLSAFGPIVALKDLVAGVEDVVAVLTAESDAA